MSSLRWLQQTSPAMPVLVCFHGWAANGDVWMPLAKAMPQANIIAIELPCSTYAAANNPQPQVAWDDFIQQVASELTAQALVAKQTYFVGWSLGGQVAAAVATLIPKAFAGLVTLASNPCFVASPSWPTAMPAATFVQFYQDFAAQPAVTLKRFYALQSVGAGNARQLRTLLKNHLPALPAESSLWLHTLQWLSQDTRALLSQLRPPQLHILAQADALVPSTAPLHTFGEVQILPEVSHCLPLECPDLVARALRIFIKTHQTKALNKQKVAQAFSQAASRYDAFARVQKTVAKQVLARMPNPQGKVLLDVGCGTGALTQALLHNSQGLPAQVLAIDIALGMLQFAQGAVGAGADFIAADAESLPLANQSIDAVVSSLAIQWCSQPQHLMRELYRVLKPSGSVTLATLGPATLWELKQAWQSIDDCVHVNAFIGRAPLEQAIHEAGLLCQSFIQLQEYCDYPSLMPLLKELKAIGAHNSHTAARAGLLTKARLKELEANYPANSLQGAPIVATYDVFYVQLVKSGCETKYCD